MVVYGARSGGRGRKEGPSRGNGSDADAEDQGGRKQEGSAVDCGGRVRGSREVRPTSKDRESHAVLEIKTDVTKKDHPSFAVTKVKL